MSRVERRPTILLRKKEVAAQLGVTPRTVDRWVKLGKLRETRMPSGNGVRSIPRYKTSDVEAFIASAYTTVPARKSGR